MTLCLLGVLPAVLADQPPAPDVQPLLRPLRAVVLKYYPKAKVSQNGPFIHFEYNTRKFMIHHALKTGEWQDASEELGPNKGGICGDIELRAGAYNGAAVSPQSFDERYFIDRLMTPYSKKLDHHLYIHLEHPHDAPATFLKEFEALMNSFDRYLEAKDKR
jgi:hypothetical protein